MSKFSILQISDIHNGNSNNYESLMASLSMAISDCKESSLLLAGCFRYSWFIFLALAEAFVKLSRFHRILDFYLFQVF